MRNAAIRKFRRALKRDLNIKDGRGHYPGRLYSRIEKMKLIVSARFDCAVFYGIIGLYMADKQWRLRMMGFRMLKGCFRAVCCVAIPTAVLTCVIHSYINTCHTTTCFTLIFVLV